jgi:hypothetical protein
MPPPLGGGNRRTHDEEHQGDLELASFGEVVVQDQYRLDDWPPRPPRARRLETISAARAADPATSGADRWQLRKIVTCRRLPPGHRLVDFFRGGTRSTGASRESPRRMRLSLSDRRSGDPALEYNVSFEISGRATTGRQCGRGRGDDDVNSYSRTRSYDRRWRRERSPLSNRRAVERNGIGRRIEVVQIR